MRTVFDSHFTKNKLEKYFLAQTSFLKFKIFTYISASVYFNESRADSVNLHKGHLKMKFHCKIDSYSNQSQVVTFKAVSTPYAMTT